MKMKGHVIVLFFLAAVFNGVSWAENRKWSYMINDAGTKMEIIDESEQPQDSESSDSELREEVIFNLFTNSNLDSPQVIHLEDDDTLASSNFDASKPTRFVIHGWLSSLTEPISVLIREAYLSTGDYNVIVIDWSAISSNPYTYARTKIVTVGKYVGRMIDYLESHGMNVNELTIAGHSLGAHIAGVAGRTAQNTVASIVAMDPAGPLFYFTVVNGRLRSTDAEYVQVIHTNAGMLGFNGQLGDVDFWPNGGTWQAGCNWDVFGQCSHQRSYYFFAESIANTKTQFVAHTCENYSFYSDSKCTENASTHMGGSSLDATATGNYYLDTNSNSPYCMG